MILNDKIKAELSKNPVRLMAFDLDNTLLNSKKELSERNIKALEAAAEAGIHIVPATGRLYKGLPDKIKELPFIKYAVAVNGAEIVDVRKNEIIGGADISNRRALEVIDIMSEYPVVYDCYQDELGLMNGEMYEQLGDYIPETTLFDFVKSMRSPVENIRKYLQENGRPVQKQQMFFHTSEERDRYMPELKARIPDLVLTSSCETNIEMNAPGATKGEGIKALSRILGFGPENGMAFGDGANDVPMIEAAGYGVAMANAAEWIRDKAQIVAPHCDEDGVAQVIEEVLKYL